ncbi:MAG: 1-hydroxycarotenoid 3,4-desaturase CrtD [Bacteroidota bacterium]
MKVIIVGSGVAGMAASIRLACQGHDVEVYEAAENPGGKLAEFRIDGFRFDAGPSLFTMPHYVDELFKLAKKDPTQFFSYKKLDTVCHYFWEDGMRFNAPADPKDFAVKAAETFQVEEKIISKYLSKSKDKYELTSPVFLEQSLHRLSNYWSGKVLKGLLNIPRLDIFQTLHTINRKQLKEEHLIQLFDRYATYNGSDPYKTPGVMSSIPHLEYGIGAFFPKGGMYTITKSIYALAKDLGVIFHFNRKVDKIHTLQNRVTGIESQKETIGCDAVVSNMDVYYTYRHLLSHLPQPEQILKQEKSSSALIFYWGMKRAFPELDVHNILFTENYAEEFNCLSNTKELYHDPTVYINITSKQSPSDAPKNCENWFTMINVPHDTGQNWQAIETDARQLIISKINRMLNTEIEPLISCEKILDPLLIQQRTSSYLGALYGTSSNSRYAAFLRHPNFSKRVKGLFFCGGSVHPGGGIPLCLLSAKIVADEFQKSS